MRQGASAFLGFEGEPSRAAEEASAEFLSPDGGEKGRGENYFLGEIAGGEARGFPARLE
jgi:hypothetical protein